MAVAKDFGEGCRWIILEVLPSLHDAGLVGIGEDGVARFHNLHPFGLWPQDDAGLLEEIGFFLHTARVSHDELGMTFQSNHLKEGDRRENLDILAARNLLLQRFVKIGLHEFGRPWMQRQHDLSLFGKLDEGSEDGVEALGMVGVAVAMNGGQDEEFAIQSQALYDIGLFLSDIGEMQAVVIHDVAAVVDLWVVDGWD